MQSTPWKLDTTYMQQKNPATESRERTVWRYKMQESEETRISYRLKYVLEIKVLLYCSEDRKTLYRNESMYPLPWLVPTHELKSAAATIASRRDAAIDSPQKCSRFGEAKTTVFVHNVKGRAHRAAEKSHPWGRLRQCHSCEVHHAV